MKKLEMPQRLPDGRVPTLNNMGAMTAKIDKIQEGFLSYSRNRENILEIGTCYGDVALKAFEKKSFRNTYTANDLDQRHLNILYNRINDKFFDETYKLKLDNSDFPEATTFPADSFDAILIANVLHFFPPAKLENAIIKISDLLVDGGCVFTSVITPYVNKFKSFIEEYEHKLAKGEDWPGYVDNLQKYANETLTTKENYQNLKDKPFNFLSSALLKRVFLEHNFEIIQAYDSPLSYESAEWQLDGRENSGLVACKINQIYDKEAFKTYVLHAMFSKHDNEVEDVDVNNSNSFTHQDLLEEISISGECDNVCKQSD